MIRAMNEQLDQYRKEIDAIDERIIALIKQRVGVVAKVGELKREHAPHVFPIRPSREARMIRCIAKEFAGSEFSPAAAAQIWRIIIGASTATEAELSISTLPDLCGLAREYFSAAARICAQTDVNLVIADVAEGRAAIGVVPRASDWWQPLLRMKNPPKVFACLPFALTGNQTAEALAISYVEPEDSGDDISLYATDTGMVEADGFATLANAQFLGAYARPFTIDTSL